MRTIRFKAKTFNQLGIEYGRWVVGWVIGKSFLVDMHGSEKEIFPTTVCQFIGEVDMYGKDIFEGDILESDSMCVEIRYVNTSFVGIFISENEKKFPPLRDSFNQWKITGNIFDKTCYV